MVSFWLFHFYFSYSKTGISHAGELPWDISLSLYKFKLQRLLQEPGIKSLNEQSVPLLCPLKDLMHGILDQKPSRTLASLFVCYIKLKKMKPVSQFPLIYRQDKVIRNVFSQIYTLYLKIFLASLFSVSYIHNFLTTNCTINILYNITDVLQSWGLDEWASIHVHKLEIYIYLFPWKAVWLLKIKIHIKKKFINLLEISV